MINLSQKSILEPGGERKLQRALQPGKIGRTEKEPILHASHFYLGKENKKDKIQHVVQIANCKSFPMNMLKHYSLDSSFAERIPDGERKALSDESYVHG